MNNDNNIHDMWLGPQRNTQREIEERATEVAEQIINYLKQGDKTMQPVLRAKMRVSEVVHVKNADGTTSQERVSLSAVYGPEGSENGQWSKWTPSAQLSISINNPDAFGNLSSGHEFFVDFTPVKA